MPVLVQWLVFLHVLSAFTFFSCTWNVCCGGIQDPSETNFDRIRAMLDLSAFTIRTLFRAFLAMGLTGLALPFVLKLWGKGWVWISIVLMLIVAIQMGLMDERRYKVLRRLVGLPYMKGSKEYPAEEPASQQDVQEFLKGLKTTDLVVYGFVIPIIVLWLMMFKPF